MNAAIQRYGDQILKLAGRGHWLGNGRLLQGEKWKKMEETNKLFAIGNNALNVAPAWKWMLSIVPLIGVFRGTPPPSQLDPGQSGSLAITGGLFAVYSLLVYPTAWVLFTCNACMFGVHTYNLGRIYKYQKEQKKEAKGEKKI